MKVDLEVTAVVTIIAIAVDGDTLVRDNHELVLAHGFAVVAVQRAVTIGVRVRRIRRGTKLGPVVQPVEIAIRLQRIGRNLERIFAGQKHHPGQLGLGQIIQTAAPPHTLR